MIRVSIRFYAELNDFLPRRRRQVSFEHVLSEHASVKHVIETLGVPHTEVDLVLVNGESMDFAYRVQDGDRISVYPVFESFDISALGRVRPRPLRETRFVLDVHLGRLAGTIAPFSRCMRCNGVLVRVEKAETEDRLLPKTRRYYDAFAVCRDCGRIYWEGSHHQDMQRSLTRLLGEAASTRRAPPIEQDEGTGPSTD